MRFTYLAEHIQAWPNHTTLFQKHTTNIMLKSSLKETKQSHDRFNPLPLLPSVHTMPKAVLTKVKLFTMFMHIIWQHLSFTFATLT